MNSLQYAVRKQLQRHARVNTQKELAEYVGICLLYTSDAADE